MRIRAAERRQPSWLTVYGALFLNRRRSARRHGEHLDAYTDWYGVLPLMATLSVILLCFADAFLTTVLINHGATELNLFMDWLIRFDLQTFAAVKMTVTGVALLVLVMHVHFRVCRFIAVRYILYMLVPLYALLLYHEIGMLASI